MKAVIVCVSVSHGNTLRVADAMARVLGASVVTPEEADPRELAAADLVGFGSGVFHGRLHPRLTAFARALPVIRSPRNPQARAFVFATSGLPEIPVMPFTRPPARLLDSKGFDVHGSAFTCRAFDTWAPFRIVGGLNRRRPDSDDLSAAHSFAERLREEPGRAV
ncbi:flavodoxin family protein [Streptomyces californicus]|uniref:flavodoxin family protein n=1 Tax=Streptomyces californicus TaxID=67351 RepID=UPI0036B3BBE1